MVERLIMKSILIGEYWGILSDWLPLLGNLIGPTALYQITGTGVVQGNKKYLSVESMPQQIQTPVWQTMQ